MDFVHTFLDIRVGMDLSNYADALDRERQKIQVFQRELPLCLELVTRGNFTASYGVFRIVLHFFFLVFCLI